VGISLDRFQRIGIAFFARHLQQVVGILDAGVDAGQRVDYVLERFLFAAQVLGALRVIPDFRVFEFAVDLFEFL
jgi:hypothetical protein